jgi:hypothetical protein
MWMLDFDLCRNMAMNKNGVQQAVSAFGEMILSILGQVEPCSTHSNISTFRPAMNAWNFVMPEKRTIGPCCRGCLLSLWKPGTTKSTNSTKGSTTT